MVDFRVREATKNDIADILELIKGLAVYEKEERSRVKITEENLLRDGFGEDPWFYCLLAEIFPKKNREVKTAIDKIEGNLADLDDADCKVVGFALYMRVFSSWDGKAVRLGNLYVKEEYRNLGIGTSLLKKVTEVSLQMGCNRMEWHVLNWNERAINFYKAIGTYINPASRRCYFHLNEMKQLVKGS